ncbi:uncharacterized protein [Lepisosteus oculatus]|uniref:uncharacterized protein isoform X1 n=2 Tax=Lepisosteus oculatus TaxID=7918 RepID=UPI0035F50FB6
MDYSRSFNYEERSDYIECKICDIKIQSKTNYKIHLTTPQHLQKEDALVACGKIRRPYAVRKWNDLMEYLDYLHLDEPIIGLHHVVEVDPKQPGDPLRYLCRLCFFEEELPGLTLHLVSRKHRQRYLETNRPDLVTWDANNTAQLGKILKAKAEIVVLQDGQGVIERSKKKILETQQKEKPSFFKKTLQSLVGKEDQSRLPRGSDRDGASCDADPDRQYRPDWGRFSPEDMRRRVDWKEDIGSLSRMDERGGPYGAKDLDRREYNQRRYREDIGEIPFQDDHLEAYHGEHLRRPYREDDRRGPYHDKDRHGPYGHEDLGRGFQGNGERRYPENDFDRRHSGDVDRRYSRDSAPAYPEDHHYRRYPDEGGKKYFDSESSRRLDKVELNSDYSEHGRSPAYSRAALGKRHRDDFPAAPEFGAERSHLGGRGREDHLERRHTPEGRSRRPPEYSPERRRIPESTSARRIMERDNFNGLPEVFKRYLSEKPGTHEMRAESGAYREVVPEDGHRGSFRGDSATGGFLAKGQSERNMEEFSHKRPRLDPLAHKQGTLASYHETQNQTTVNPNAVKGDVLEALKSIEIESIEDATFFKDKVCDLLKEFQANKATGVTSPVISKDYNHMSMDTGVHERDRYGGHPDFEPVEAPRGSGVPLYRRSVSAERKSSDRWSYPERPRYAQKDPQHLGRRPPAERTFYPPRPAHTGESLRGARGSWAEGRKPGEMPQGKQSSLEKITSTLLELVSRGTKI